MFLPKEKKKLSGQTTGEDTKAMEIKRKVPLKAEMIEKLKALEKKYDVLVKDILKLILRPSKNWRNKLGLSFAKLTTAEASYTLATI